MNENIKQIIFDSIDELNQTSATGENVDKSEDIILYGKNGQLDSLGLVNLIVIIEQNIEDFFNCSITLADERAMSQKNSPFKSINSLVEYISNLLEDMSNEK